VKIKRKPFPVVLTQSRSQLERHLRLSTYQWRTPFQSKTSYHSSKTNKQTNKVHEVVLQR